MNGFMHFLTDSRQDQTDDPVYPCMKSECAPGRAALLLDFDLPNITLIENDLWHIQQLLPEAGDYALWATKGGYHAVFANWCRPEDVLAVIQLMSAVLTYQEVGYGPAHWVVTPRYADMGAGWLCAGYSQYCRESVQLRVGRKPGRNYADIQPLSEEGWDEPQPIFIYRKLVEEYNHNGAYWDDGVTPNITPSMVDAALDAILTPAVREQINAQTVTLSPDQFPW